MHRLPSRQRDRRFPWLRLYSDFPGHPKWRLVALKAEITVTEAVAIAATLLCHANKSRPRGSLAEFSPLECAAALSIGPEAVQRAYDALEELGWIDHDHLVTWDERNPDIEDPTAVDRQRRRRAKAKAQRTGKKDVSEEFERPPVRKSVTVTHRDVTLEESRRSKRPADEAPVENSGDLDLQGAARDVLNREGAEITSRRLGLRLLAAQALVARWYQQVQGDALFLVDLLTKTDKQNVSGDEFDRIVSQRVKTRETEITKGLALPLGPSLVARKAG